MWAGSRFSRFYHSQFCVQVWLRLFLLLLVLVDVCWFFFVVFFWPAGHVHLMIILPDAFSVGSVLMGCSLLVLSFVFRFSASFLYGNLPTFPDFISRLFVVFLCRCLSPPFGVLVSHSLPYTHSSPSPQMGFFWVWSLRPRQCEYRVVSNYYLRRLRPYVLYPQPFPHPWG